MASVLYPELMVAAGTSQGLSILSNASDFTYGLFTQTGPPKGWGYLSSGGMFFYQVYRRVPQFTFSTPQFINRHA